MLHDLLTYDLSAFKIRQLPQTRARQDQAVASLDPTLRWWQDRLLAGTLDGQAWPERIERQKLYDDYLATITKWRVPHPHSHALLGRTLRQVAPSLSSGQGTMGDRFYRIPSLAQARMMFEAHLGQPVDWGTDTDD